jgi:hypothetical protein
MVTSLRFDKSGSIPRASLNLSNVIPYAGVFFFLAITEVRVLEITPRPLACDSLDTPLESSIF